MAKLNTKELVDLFYKCQREGKNVPTILFTKPVYEENYLDAGMKANLTGVNVEEVCEEYTMYKLTFEWDDFVEENIKKETADWYDGNNIPCLTASQSGNRPLNNREWTYSSDDCPDKYFIVDEEDYVHSLDKETHKNIIDSLLLQRGIVTMRIDEAKDAEAWEDVESNKNHLEIVDRALKQLRYNGENE